MTDATASDDVAFDDLPPRGMRPVKTPEEAAHDAGHPDRHGATPDDGPCCPFGEQPPVMAPDADADPVAEYRARVAEVEAHSTCIDTCGPGCWTRPVEQATMIAETPDISVPACRVRTLTLPKVHAGQGIFTQGAEMSPGFVFVIDRVGESASDPRVIEVWHGLAEAAGARTFILCAGEVELDPWIEKLIELARTPRKR